MTSPFQAIMAVKAPQVYGPHLAQADAPLADQGAQPKPGSFQAIMSAKAPQAYGPHLAAADAAFLPGSFDAGANCAALVDGIDASPNRTSASAKFFKVCFLIKHSLIFIAS